MPDDVARPPPPQGQSMLEGELTVQRLSEACIEAFRADPSTMAILGILATFPPLLVIVVQQVATAGLQEVWLRGDIGYAAFFALAWILGMIGIAPMVYASLGMTRYCLEFVRGASPTIGSVFRAPNSFLSGLVAYWLWTVAMGVGGLCFIVPGVVLGMGLLLFFFGVVDRGLGPIASLRDSWRLTHGYKSLIFGWTMASGTVLSVAGCLTCMIGWAVLSPPAWIGFAWIYEHARVRHGA